MKITHIESVFFFKLNIVIYIKLDNEISLQIDDSRRRMEKILRISP